VVHTDLTHPYCPEVSAALQQACSVVGALYEPSAVYVGVEGPRYETPAEIKLYASWGAHVIGMTCVPEVALAREAGLCYGALAIVTNLACGLSPTPLAHDEVRAAVHSAADRTHEVLRAAIGCLPETASCACSTNTQLSL